MAYNSHFHRETLKLGNCIALLVTWNSHLNSPRNGLLAKRHMIIKPRDLEFTPHNSVCWTRDLEFTPHRFLVTWNSHLKLRLLVIVRSLHTWKSQCFPHDFETLRLGDYIIFDFHRETLRLGDHITFLVTWNSHLNTPLADHHACANQKTAL